jgi:hypothetical protein
MKRFLPLILAAACAPQAAPLRPDHSPLSLPPIDGQPVVVHRAPSDYALSRTQTSHGFEMRVTRLGRDFTQGEERIARGVAEIYCAAYNRKPAPGVARFSQPNAWVLAGDCA